MKAKLTLIFCVICLLLAAGCRNYTASRNSSSKDNEYDGQAIEEENNALENRPLLSNDGTGLWEELKSREKFDYSYDDKGDTVTLKSKNFEITSGGKEIGVIYITIYNDHPLDDQAVRDELFELLKTISEYLNVPYNEQAIIDNISNVNYSVEGDSYKCEYSESIDLFCCLWNDGIRDCIDFRIMPKG